MKFYQGKTVWIIGGTSGIGLALAQKLGQIEACRVIISGRNTAKLDSLNLIPLDVTKPNDFYTATDDILAKYGKIDIVLFCAGAYEPMNLESFNAQTAESILQTNLGSMVNFVAILPKLYGKCELLGIVSSVAGYFGMPNSLFYGASKAGLSNLCESLCIELKKHDIKVKLINPGFVDTRLTQKNSFKMPFIISTQKAAEIILAKLPKNNFEIAFPTAFILIMKCLQSVPFKLRSFLFTKSTK